MTEPVILDSARRHGVSDEDMQHAFRNPVGSFLVGEDMTMVIGADQAGRLTEVGVVEGLGESPRWSSHMPCLHVPDFSGGDERAALARRDDRACR